MSVPPDSSPPQELLDFLTARGVDPATVTYWRLLLHLLRVIRNQQSDIAAIKQKLGL